MWAVAGRQDEEKDAAEKKEEMVHIMLLRNFTGGMRRSDKEGEIQRT